MPSKDEKEIQKSEDRRFNSTVSSPILDIMRQQGKRKGDKPENFEKTSDDNTSPKRFPFNRRRK